MEVDNQIIDLQTKLDQETKLSQMKDEQIEECKSKIRDLEGQILTFSKTGYDEIDDFLVTHFQQLHDEFNKVENNNIELRQRLLKIMSKKNRLKKQNNILKLKTVPISPKCPSGPEAEIQNLKIELSNKQTDLDFLQEQVNIANEEAEKYQKDLYELREKDNEWRIQSTKNFNIMKLKLEEQREKMSSNDVGRQQLAIENLQTEINNQKKHYDEQINSLNANFQKAADEKDKVVEENAKLLETINSMTDTYQNMTNEQTGFISTLLENFGCKSIKEVPNKIKDLTGYQQKCEELQKKIVSLKNGEITQTTNDDVIDALKQIQTQLSPNELNLPHDSELRQLFAALCNMLNAALNPNASKSLLKPHVLSVVHQARFFKNDPNSDEKGQSSLIVTDHYNRHSDVIEPPKTKQFD